MIAPALFSTGKDDWETPFELFDALHEEFGFTLDLAANAQNAKCARWVGPGGLAPDLLAYTVGADERGWMNPPYSRAQANFVAKAATCGALVVALLPARTDTRMFHRYIWDEKVRRPRTGVEVRLLRGRLRFVGAPASAPFPSMIVVFNKH
jgi:site-specific DNA-methyltransferase (adenine-specific)